MGMTTYDAAEYLGISQDHISRLCKSGIIQAKKHGPLWNLDITSVNDYKSSHKFAKKKTRSTNKPKPIKTILDEQTFLVLKEIQAFRLLIELESCIDSLNAYQSLGAAKVIRELLIDQPPMIEFVVPNYEESIKFTIGKTLPKVSQQNISANAYQLIQDSLDPGSTPNYPNEDPVSLSQFLSSIVLIANDFSYSIRDIILLESEIITESEQDGIVEFGKVVAQISSKISPGGITPAIRQLKAIGRVVLRSVESYREEVTFLHVDLQSNTS